MSMSFSQACASARKPSPPMAKATRSGTVPHKQRETSSLLKAQPKRRRCIRLRPATAEECAQTAAYFQQCPKRSVEFWRAKNRKRAEARAAVTAR